MTGSALPRVTGGGTGTREKKGESGMFSVERAASAVANIKFVEVFANAASSAMGKAMVLDVTVPSLSSIPVPSMRLPTFYTNEEEFTDAYLHLPVIGQTGLMSGLE